MEHSRQRNSHNKEIHQTFPVVLLSSRRNQIISILFVKQNSFCRIFFSHQRALFGPCSLLAANEKNLYLVLQCQKDIISPFRILLLLVCIEENFRATVSLEVSRERSFVCRLHSERSFSSSIYILLGWVLKIFSRRQRTNKMELNYVIDKSTIAEILSYPLLIEHLRKSFSKSSSFEIPERQHYALVVEEEGLQEEERSSSGAGTLLLMPAWCQAPQSAYIGVKIVSVFPGNGSRGLPAVAGSYFLSSSETGWFFFSPQVRHQYLCDDSSHPCWISPGASCQLLLAFFSLFLFFFWSELQTLISLQMTISPNPGFL